jgi:hypothetical protein
MGRRIVSAAENWYTRCPDRNPVTKYQVFGPFRVPRNGTLVDKHGYNKFWADIGQNNPGLQRAVGCYIFAVRAAKGELPWYVGKTERGSFKGETWSPHKLNLYNESLNSRKKGTALLYLIARRTRVGRFAKPRKAGRGDIRAWENLLIGICLLRNRDLLNVKQTKHLRGIVVPGYMNERPGARSAPARRLAKLLGT